jgi:type II secretory pathway pseudopilin PulG
MTKYQRGQTLIETLVAIFVMVMGITASLGLANYSLHASSNISQQVIGIGLAREGLEAMKNMRDTNWLIDTLSTDCYNYKNGSPTAPCYKNWQNPPGGYNIGVQSSALPDPITGYPYDFYKVSLDSSLPGLWAINYFDPTGCTVKYGMNYDPNASLGWFYYPVDCGVNGTSDFHRQISVQKEAVAPFNQDVGPQLVVYSRVWWTGKNCPLSQTYSAARSGCKVTAAMYLNNWKNY